MFKIEVITRREAKDFMGKGKKPLKASKYFGVIYNGKLTGFFSYGKPMGMNVANSISDKINQDKVYKLKDMFFRDYLSAELKSELLNVTCNIMKNIYDVQAIIAHVPVGDKESDVLKENIWLSQGKILSKKRYLHNINGEVLCDRTCWDRYRTTSRERLLEIDSNYTRIPIPKKERFIKILDEDNFDKIIAGSKYDVMLIYI